mgnify:CR=1 FL=1
MANCKMTRKVPITKFHRKNFYKMLDMGTKIGNIRVLTFVYTRKIGNKLFPNVANSSKFPQKSYSETGLFCTAHVPLASHSNQWKKKVERRID